MQRHRQALRRRARRLARRVARGRAAARSCAGRPERRRQVDADQGPDRRLPQGRRHDHCSTAQPFDVASPQEAQRGGISTIYQEINLIPFRSVAENIFLGRETAPLRPARLAAACTAGAPSVLRRFDVESMCAGRSASSPPRSSRWSRSRAPSRFEARLVIMDEPTSSLDEHEVAVLFGVDPPAQARGRAGHLRQPQARRALRGLRPRHRHARRPHRRDRAAWPTSSKLAARRGHARPRPGDGRGARCRPPSTASAHADRQRAAARPTHLQVGHARARRQLRGAAPARSSASPACSAPAAPRRRARSSAPIAPTRGTIRFDGQDGTSRRRPTPSPRGIGFCSEDRKAEGIVPDMSVRENLTLALLPQLSRSGIVDEARQREIVERFIKRLGIKCSGPEQKIRELSGGNQQKVLLARWLCMNPQAPDPRRADARHRRRRQGRDPALIRELADEGLGVLMISSELEEIDRGRRPRLRAARRPHRRRARRRARHRDQPSPPWRTAMATADGGADKAAPPGRPLQLATPFGSGSLRHGCVRARRC